MFVHFKFSVLCLLLACFLREGGGEQPFIYICHPIKPASGLSAFVQQHWPAVATSATEKSLSNLNKLDKEFLKKVTDIVEENLSMDKMDVAFIADKMCMSHSTLYRKIKGLTDMSVNEFIRKIKMRKSVELLADGEHSIAEISDLTGFSSVAYFRQCFKDEYGMAPSEYLRKKI